MKNIQKVTIITQYWLGSRGGGILTYTRELKKALEVHGATVRIIAGEGKKREAVVLEQKGLLFSLRAFFQLLKEKPRRIFTHNNWYCLLPALLHAKLFGSTVIHFFHSWPSKTYSRLQSALFKGMLRNAATIVFSSNALQQEYSLMMGPFKTKTRVLHGGIPEHIVFSKEQEEAFLKKYGLEEEHILLLMHGATSHELKYEGGILLLRAVKTLLTEFPSIRIIFTREGEFLEKLQCRSRELNLGQRVIFTGDLEHPALAMQACSVYTHITLVEGGVSMSLLEAIAYRKKIVATVVGGIEELKKLHLIDHPAEPVPEKITAAIRSAVLEHQYGKRTGKALTNRIPDALNWNKTAGLLLK